MRELSRQPGIALISVIAPVLNEEENVRAFVDRVTTALVDEQWELIVVDDGSSDGTGRVLGELATADPRVRVLRFSRNFGHQAALTAGIDFARGDAVITIDGDLQDPPELIPELLACWRQGLDVVHAVRSVRLGEPRWRMAMIGMFYRLFTGLASVESVPQSGDFRLLDRAAIHVLSGMRERYRFLRGLSVWVGFRQGRVEYARDPRPAGVTKYPIRRLFALAADGIVSFSFVPLRLAAAVGALISVVALLAIPVVVALRISGEYVPGLASVTIVVLALGGLQLFTLGVIGEYLGRTYEESKRRPLYIVAEVSDPDADGPIVGWASGPPPAAPPKSEPAARFTDG